MSQQSTESPDKIAAKRAKNAQGGFFHNGAIWLLSRFPLTKHKYQNWTRSRRILVGWLLWLICLPIIPAVAIAVWYFSDPEGFKRSPWAKGLIGLFVVWLGAFGYIATNQAVPDQDGRYSPVQTQQSTTDQSQPCDSASDRDCDSTKTDDTTKQADSETKVVNDDPAGVASEKSKEKVKNLKESQPTRGRQFKNCTAAFEAGVFNIKRSSASYQKKLDRDGDGIACER